MTFVETCLLPANEALVKQVAKEGHVSGTITTESIKTSKEHSFVIHYL